MAAIFKRFQYRYGSKFISSIEGIEEEVIKEWSKRLAGLTGTQIKHGLDTWREDWPPSSEEFYKVCKDTRQECHRIFPKLEVLKSDKQTAEKYIKQMKENLK